MTLSLVSAAILLACGTATPAAAGVVRVAGTAVSLAPPSDFVPAKQFPGFQHDRSGSSIMVTEMAGPYAEFRGAMTKEAMATRGMTLLSSESARFANLEGLLVSATQTANGIVYRKWLGVFGTAEKTVMLVASFPESAAAALSEPIKQSLLSARWNAAAQLDVHEGLTYRIKEPASLKVSTRSSNMLMLTKGGRPGPVPPEDPLVVVGNSIGQGTIADVEDFARRRILQTAQVKEIGDIKGRAVTIAGSSGYELTATAKDLKSGTPLVLYQTILVRKDGYVLVQGLVGAAASEIYLPEFRQLAQSLTFIE